MFDLSATLGSLTAKLPGRGHGHRDHGGSGLSKSYSLRSLPEKSIFTAEDPEAAMTESLKSLRGDGRHDHWHSHEHFVEVENERRELNRQCKQLRASRSLQRVKTGAVKPSSLKASNEVFISHSWRNPDNQERKRRLISQLSLPTQEDEVGPGLSYWADFLDLVATGPVPWRKEIEDGIESATKFVAFIDKEYILSYNCLEELAMAKDKGKIVVPVILDNFAWTMLVDPRGADKAWEMSAELRNYEGRSVSDKLPAFGIRTLRSLFGFLSHINFCGCRNSDIEAMGIDAAANNLRMYVEKEIHYLKEHEDITTQASIWVSHGKRWSSALLLDEAGLTHWKAWYRQNKAYNAQPEPTRLHLDYIESSQRLLRMKKLAMRSLAAFVLFCILAGAVASGILAVRAREAEGIAADQAVIARQQAQIAKQEAENAGVQKAIAEQEAQNAMRQEERANQEKAGVLVWSLLATAGRGEVDSYVALKLVRQAFALLPFAKRPELNHRTINLFRHLLHARPGAIVCSGLLDSGSPVGFSFSFKSSSENQGIFYTAVTDPAAETRTVWNMSSIDDAGHSVNMLDGDKLATGPSGVDVVVGAMAGGDIHVWEQKDQPGSLHGSWTLVNILRNFTSMVWTNALSTDLRLASVDFGLGPDKRIRLWDDILSAQPRLQLLYDYTGSAIRDMAWQPGGTSLVSHASAGEIRLWEFDADGMVAGSRVLIGADVLGCLVWADDGAKLAVCLSDKTAVVMDVSSNTSVAYPATPGYSDSFPVRGRWESGLRTLPDGLWYSSGTSDNEVIVYSPTLMDDHEDHASRLNSAQGQQVQYLTVSPDGQWVAASYTYGRQIDLWHVPSGSVTEQHSLALPGNAGLNTRSSWLALKWVEDGIAALQTATSPEGELQTSMHVLGWNGAATANVLDDPYLRRKNCQDWSLDGRLLAFAAELDPAVFLLDTSLGLDDSGYFLETPLTFVPGTVEALRFSPDSENIVIVASSWSGAASVVVTLVHIPTRRSQTLEKPKGWATGTQLSWTSDSRYLAGSSTVWHVPPGGDPAAVAMTLQDSSSAGSHGQAWSPSGTTLAVGLPGGVVQVWEDLRGGSADVHALSASNLSPTDGSSANIAVMEFSPNGTFLVTGGQTGLITLWRLTAPAFPAHFRLSGHSNVIFSHSRLTAKTPSGAPRPLIISGSFDSTMRLWDPNAEAYTGLARLPGHSSWVYCLKYSPSGAHLASGSKDGTIRVWEVANMGDAGEGIQPDQAVVLHGHNGSVATLAWSEAPLGPDVAWTLASGSSDGSVLLHSMMISSGETVQTSLSDHAGPVTALAWAPQGHHVVTGGADGLLVVHDISHASLEEGDLAPIVLTGHEGSVTRLAFAPSGVLLASASEDSDTVQVWHFESAVASGSQQEIEPVQSLVPVSQPGQPMSPEDSTPSWGQPAAGRVPQASGVVGLVFSADGSTLAIATSGDSNVFLYSLEEESQQLTFFQQLDGASGALVTAISSSPVGSLAVGRQDGTVELYDASSNFTHTALPGQQGAISCLEFSPDGSSLASAARGELSDGGVRVWALSELSGGPPFPEVWEGSPAARVGALSFSPDGRRLAFPGERHEVHVAVMYDTDEASAQLEALMWGDKDLSLGDVLALELPQDVLM